MARLVHALVLLALLPASVQAQEDFLDPSLGDVPPPRTVERPPPHREPRPPPTNPITPPRRADTWELAATTFAFFPITDTGVGFITRAHVLYRFELPLMVRLDLMPLGMSFADDGRGAGAFGLLSAGLDLQGFGLSVGIGAASNNEHDGNTARATTPEPGAMTTVVFGTRIGVSDGLAGWLRSGFAIDHERGEVRFALFEALAQVPFGDQWAMTVRGGWTMSGNAEARVGMRVWLEGRGAAGSIALFLDGGLGRFVYRPPLRGRGYPDRVDHLGPGFGVGVEGRM